MIPWEILCKRWEKTHEACLRHQLDHLIQERHKINAWASFTVCPWGKKTMKKIHKQSAALPTNNWANWTKLSSLFTLLLPCTFFKTSWIAYEMRTVDRHSHFLTHKLVCKIIFWEPPATIIYKPKHAEQWTRAGIVEGFLYGTPPFLIYVISSS